MTVKRKARVHAFGDAAVAFGRDTSAAVIMATAVMSVVLVGFAGLAVDVGGWYWTKRSMQGGADAAALYAALELANPDHTDSVVATAANTGASDNGISPSSGAQVIVNIAANDLSVNVVISEPGPTGFSSLLLTGPVDIRATATASLDGGPVCILALEPSQPHGLKIDSNAQINTDGCSIQVNSTKSTAAGLNSNASVTVVNATICVTGDYSVQSNAGFSPTPDTGSDCPPPPDPLEGLAPPPSAGCDFTDVYLDDQTTTLLPGIYCGGLTLDGNSNVTLAPSVYVIKGGDFHVESNSALTGDGVAIYLTDGAKIHFDSNSSIDLKAPTDGPLAGIIFYKNRNEGGVHYLDSNKVSRLEGTIYLPNGTLHSDSNATIGAGSAFTIVIVRRLELDSNANLVVNSNYEASDVPLPLILAAKRVKLTG